MYNNYFFLKKFTEELRTRILGEVLEVCYTQHKQELVITFSNGINLLSILHSGWSIVRIPERINRAKKNTMDLFAPLIGNKVEEVRIIDYDRSFYILLGEYKLLFKLHGSRGNIILLKDDQVAELFINAYEKDKQLQFNDIGKHFPDFNKFVEANGNIKSVFPVLGKEAIGLLDTLGYNQLSVDKKWEKFNEIVASFNEASEYFLIKNNNDVQLLLFQEKENTGEVSVFKSPSEALEKFFYLKIRNDTFQQKVDSLKREKLKQEHRLSSFISKLEARWEQLLEEDPNKYLADVIMANIHNLFVKHGDVSLVGFNNEEVHVDFKGKSPIKFAENLYRKSKNRKIEIAKTEEHLEDKQKELEAVRKEISQLNDAVDLSDVKTFSLKKASQEIQKTPVFHEIEINGFKVLIGKNSKNNDKLTFGEGFKEDLWLHVKDAPGSHVLIKYQSGKTFPSDVIEFAAQQAAFFSKRKTESWVPVIYTPRKFIRKRKGAPAGEVVVEKESVILVQPVSHLR